MPTPFMHLQIAEKIKSSLPPSPSEADLQALLAAEWPAFYLGSVAPDYQTICNVPRAQTHFYDMPPEPDNMGYTRLLAQNPQLAHAIALPAATAVFLAGYMAHIYLDLVWLREILYPLFVKAPDIGDRNQRHLLHLVVLTYLDGLAYQSLPESAGAILAAARPTYALNFAADVDLVKWRDFLVPQLAPGAALETIPIFAGRLGFTPQEFAARLEDPAWMQSRVFDLIPVEQIQLRLETAVAESTAIIEQYLFPVEPTS